jgi:hypothetical protein
MGLQMAANLRQGLLVGLLMLLHKGVTVSEAALQFVHQQRHRWRGHTGWPGMLQHLQQLPGIARQGGIFVEQKQAGLQGGLILLMPSTA